MEGENNCPYLCECNKTRISGASCRTFAYTSCPDFIALQQEEAERAEEECDRRRVPRIIELASKSLRFADRETA
jgi:hypothetical protein